MKKQRAEAEIKKEKDSFKSKVGCPCVGVRHAMCTPQVPAMRLRAWGSCSVLYASYLTLTAKAMPCKRRKPPSPLPLPSPLSRDISLLCGISRLL